MTDHDDDVRERVARAIHRAMRAEVRWSECNTAAADAFSALRPGDKLGNGLVAVPEEPTEAMLHAGSASHALISRGMAGDCYRAMLAAAKETE